jgi:hypothetical protein
MPFINWIAMRYQLFHFFFTSCDCCLQVNRHPEIANIMKKYLSDLVGAGIELIMQFTDLGAFGSWGCWGLMEFQDQDPKTAPKYQAMQEFIAANASKCPAGGDSTSGGTNSTVPPGQPSSNCPGNGSCSGNGECLGDVCYCNTGTSA